MTETGPERILIQLKQSLLESDTLDTELANLALLEARQGMTVEKRWAGVKYIELLSFPATYTEEEAQAVVDVFQQTSSIEKVVAVSAFNLEFTSGDFGEEFGPYELIPDAVRRALDNPAITRPPMPAALEQVVIPHVPGEMIVRWKDEYVWHAQQTGFAAEMAAFNAIAGTTVLYDLYSSSRELIQVLGFDETLTSLADQLDRYNASQWVEYAQPDFLYSSQLIPNDPGYTNPGQPNLVRISAPNVGSVTGAWDITTGTQSLVVAVGDSGANINHPDFAPNLSAGHNFISNNNDVTDDNGHGSNVAAIIGAKGNNGQYMTGVDWNVSLLHLKIINAGGGTSSKLVADAIKYAYPRQALAINLSLGSTTPQSSVDLTMRDAIRLARDNNMVVVAAAGNANPGFDEELPGKLIFPADIATDNVIAVGATNLDAGDTRAGFSNWGRYRVELGAPGVQILGLTQALGFYSRFDGTSQATPHVTGALELVRSAYPWENYAGIKDRVLMGTDDRPSLTNYFRTGGRLNLKKALQKRTLILALSTRAKVGTVNNIVIGGFIITTDPANTGIARNLKVAIRGIGPSLPPLSVARLNNPKIRLNNSNGTQIAANTDWHNLPQTEQAELINAGLAPADNREAAMIRTLAPGAYTVFLESQDGQLGVGLFEIYDLEGSTKERTRLAAVSTRCQVGTGDEVAIAGTILGNPNGSGSAVPKRRILSFGKGPSLAAFRLTGLLPNPYLEFHNSSGIVVANDQWKDIDGASTGLEDKLNEPKPGFAPKNVNESAVWPTLQTGGYTAILKNSGAGTGLGLVEFYEY